MKDLGKTIKEPDLYPSMPSSGKSQKKIYPNISLPLEVFDRTDLELGEDVTITLKGKITRVEKSKWAEDASIEIISGEGICNDKKDEKKEEGTLLGDS